MLESKNDKDFMIKIIDWGVSGRIAKNSSL